MCACWVPDVCFRVWCVSMSCVLCLGVLVSLTSHFTLSFCDVSLLRGFTVLCSFVQVRKLYFVKQGQLKVRVCVEPNSKMASSQMPCEYRQAADQAPKGAHSPSKRKRRKSFALIGAGDLLDEADQNGQGRSQVVASAAGTQVCHSTSHTNSCMLTVETAA